MRLATVFTAVFLAFASSSAFALEEISRSEVYDYFFGISDSRTCDDNVSCKMLKRHIARDSKRCVMNPLETQDQKNYVLESSRGEMISVSGFVRYLGTVPGSYGYDTIVDIDGVLEIESRIHFSNLNKYSQPEIDALRNRLLRASDIWTHNNRFSDYPVRFKLKLEENRRRAHISAKLLDRRTRGPYFSRWSIQWGVATLAHEFGHMLGLDDEYANNPFGGSQAGCSKRSIMCSSHGSPQDYQYYVIFRRLLCQ